MKALHRIVLLIWAVFLAACAHSYRISPTPDPAWNYLGGTEVSFRVPNGWIPTNKNLEDQMGFSLLGQRGKNVVVLGVRVFHLDPYQSSDPSDQARLYLEGILRHEDSRVTMTETASFDAGTNGTLKVYRYYSDYFKNRFIATIIRGRTIVEVSLYGEDVDRVQSAIPALEDLARTVRIKNP